jgi:hypothetical protein
MAAISAAAANTPPIILFILNILNLPSPSLTLVAGRARRDTRAGQSRRGGAKLRNGARLTLVSELEKLRKLGNDQSEVGRRDPPAGMTEVMKIKQVLRFLTRHWKRTEGRPMGWCENLPQ